MRQISIKTQISVILLVIASASPAFAEFRNSARILWGGSNGSESKASELYGLLKKVQGAESNSNDEDNTKDRQLWGFRCASRQQCQGRATYGGRWVNISGRKVELLYYFLTDKSYGDLPKAFSIETIDCINHPGRGGHFCDLEFYKR